MFLCCCTRLLYSNLLTCVQHPTDQRASRPGVQRRLRPEIGSGATAIAPTPNGAEHLWRSLRAWVGDCASCPFFSCPPRGSWYAGRGQIRCPPTRSPHPHTAHRNRPPTGPLNPSDPYAAPPSVRKISAGPDLDRTRPGVDQRENDVLHVRRVCAWSRLRRMLSGWHTRTSSVIRISNSKEAAASTVSVGRPTRVALASRSCLCCLAVGRFGRVGPQRPHARPEVCLDPE